MAVQIECVVDQKFAKHQVWQNAADDPGYATNVCAQAPLQVFATRVLELQGAPAGRAHGFVADLYRLNRLARGLFDPARHLGVVRERDQTGVIDIALGLMLEAPAD